MFRDYGQVPPKKLITTTSFTERDTVEESIVVANTAARYEEVTESVQIAKLEFSEPREDSPKFDMEMIDGDDSEKINLSAIEVQDEVEKETAM